MMCIVCILAAAVQQNVSVEIVLLKSSKKTCQLWKRNLMMYVVLFVLYSIWTVETFYAVLLMDKVFGTISIIF